MYKGFREISNKWANMKNAAELLNSITSLKGNDANGSCFPTRRNR